MSNQTASLPTPRAIGVARISQRGGRDDDELHSLDNQVSRMMVLCQAQGWELARVLREDGVSGGAQLAKRPGLLAAVTAIESGEADVLVVAFKDRLDREPAVRDEVIDRIEAKGGIVWAADHGRDTNETPTSQFSGTVLSAAGRMQRRDAGIRARAAVAEAVAQGKAPWRHIIPGYRRGADGRLVVHEDEARAVRGAFELRASGASVREVCEYLKAHGIPRNYQSTQSLLTSTVVLGRIDFGTLVNETAHDPIIEQDVWDAVQRTRVPRGRQAKSQRLLARLGVLCCATCGARMTVSTSPPDRGRKDRYRCPPNGDCPAKAHINADLIEPLVEQAVRDAVGDAQGAASAVTKARDARTHADALNEKLQRTLRGFAAAGVDDEPGSVERLTELRAARDEAQAQAAALETAAGSMGIVLGSDYDRLSLAERRELIRTVVAEVLIGRGYGLDRVTLRLAL